MPSQVRVSHRHLIYFRFLQGVVILAHTLDRSRLTTLKAISTKKLCKWENDFIRRSGQARWSLSFTSTLVSYLKIRIRASLTHSVKLQRLSQIFKQGERIVNRLDWCNISCKWSQVKKNIAWVSPRLSQRGGNVGAGPKIVSNLRNQLETEFLKNDE